jgi:hypothetical protein
MSQYIIICRDDSGEEVWGIYDDEEYAQEYMKSLMRRHPDLDWYIQFRT